MLLLSAISRVLTRQLKPNPRIRYTVTKLTQESSEFFGVILVTMYRVLGLRLS